MNATPCFPRGELFELCFTPQGGGEEHTFSFSELKENSIVPTIDLENLNKENKEVGNQRSLTERRSEKRVSQMQQIISEPPQVPIPPTTGPAVIDSLLLATIILYFFNLINAFVDKLDKK